LPRALVNDSDMAASSKLASLQRATALSPNGKRMAIGPKLGAEPPCG
jgi:hypothetical protein